MTTRELFDIPARLEREIRMDIERIQHYRDAAVRCTSNMEQIAARGCGNHSKVADAAEMIADAEKALEKKRAALQEITLLLVDIIYSLDCELYTKVLYLKFIEYKNFVAIGHELNYTDSYMRRVIPKCMKAAEEYIIKNCPEILEESNRYD